MNKTKCSEKGCKNEGKIVIEIMTGGRWVCNEHYPNKYNQHNNF